jgi:hypothetical protein
METIATYRGRAIRQSDVSVIKQIISTHPDRSRRFISQEVCRIWNWRQTNGTLKDMVCRSLLLLLESKGFIKLPPRKSNPPNPLANRKKPLRIPVDESAVEYSLNELYPINLKQVRRTAREKLFNSLISEYHYLGYSQPVGAHLKYMAFSNGRPIACLAYGSAPWYIGVRDRFIGWPAEIRKKNLHLIINNIRFLILPWVKVPHLASHMLAISRKRVSEDWKRIYKHPVYLLETFVDTERFYATCYKADNWIYVGETTGLGKLSKSNIPTLPKKAVYVYPLSKDFRNKLNKDPSASQIDPLQEARQC